ETAMLIPELAATALRGLRVVDLDEADTALDEPAGDQTLPAKDLRRFIVQAIQSFGCRRFALDVESGRRFQLHPVGELERLDASTEPAIFLPPEPVKFVQLFQHIELFALLVGRKNPVLQVRDRALQIGNESPLIGGRQEAGTP